MTYKKIIITYFLSLFHILVFAQQRPYYSQYNLNDFIINPAIAGIENYWDLKISHRHQWAGLDGAPVTTYLTIQGPLTKSTGERETTASVRAPGENPRGKSFLQNYQAADPHQGLGLTILNDRAGPLNRFAAFATYAYHLPLGPRTSIGGGISLGIQNLRLDANALYFGEAYPVDPAVSGSGYINTIKPDISAGLYLYSARYFIGLAAQQIIPQRVGFNDGKIGGDSISIINGRLIPHLFFQAGYKFLLSEDISMMSSFMVKYVNPVPISLDLNIKFQYRDIIWTGASFRPKDGFSALLGVNINSSINIGYSYDYNTSKLNTVSSGTHEILVGFLLGNRYGDWCPRNIW
ncbi:MAG: type IX secretion system membrane protein PorP/SprF [Bacteroidetes bacterium]|nr:type IX secretion system membrane protein PorP/SprF [Bacteroidota bacterium]